MTLSFGDGHGHRAGARLPAQAACPTTRSIDLAALDLPADDLHHAGALVRARRRPPGRRLPARGAARLAARHRARADRRAPAAGDVRPLGHRRALDEPPPADRRPDDLHLRRPPGRRRDHPPGLHRASSSSSPTRYRLDRRVPVRVGLPVVRAVAEVRQPQRAAGQGGRARAAGRGCCRVRRRAWARWRAGARGSPSGARARRSPRDAARRRSAHGRRRPRAVRRACGTGSCR